MDTSRLDDALAAVQRHVEHDKVETAAQAAENRLTRDRAALAYRVWLDDLRRAALGQPPVPRLASPEQYQQYLLHRARGAIR